MLSAQTTDKQVNKTTAVFFDKIKNPQDVVDRGQENLQNAIRSVNLYIWKSKNIYKTSEILLNEYNSIIPDKVEELIKLPWVGEKTAKVVLHNLYDQAWVAVDTHIHRVANRLWRVDAKTPLKTSAELELLINDHNKIYAHHAILLFGRYHCTARNPKCETCPFTKTCKWYKENKKSK